MNLWLFALTTLVMILLPVALAIGLRRRYPVPWRYFCVGVLTFIGAQLVHLPLNELLTQNGILPEGAEGSGALAQMAVVLGLTAGLSEELARVVGYWLVPRARRYQDGVMMGLGHGGIEAMIVGGILVAASAASLWHLQRVDTLPEGLSLEQIAALHQQLEQLAETPLLAFAPLIERTLALLLQVSLSVMVLQAFVRRSWLYVVAAILYHAAVDAILVYVGITTQNPWLLEALFAALTLPAVLWTWRLRPSIDEQVGRRAASMGTEIDLFAVSLGKEMLYQWRSRRVIIVLAVFALFGMISPLLAKFTPQLLRSIEEAAQFAELIPEPTIGDAMDQYIRNLTQFGIVLAILLGMGAIAGEKEKGTAASILSKPLPRWAFVASKFVAQAAVYLLAFAVAAVGAYYYSGFLFGAPALEAFVIVNLSLYAWLLVFVAITLLGSAIGKSTGAAAGVAVVGTALVLLAASIPGYGALAPSGLVGWAGQLAAGEQVAPNGGAIATCLVVVLLALITTLAVFEEQEI